MRTVSVGEKLSGCLVLIDKPAGPSSAQVCVWTSAILGVKCGHCGTLDPPVTGVLPILAGKGIKLLEFLQLHDKNYVCAMRLSTQVSEEKLRGLFSEFKGDLYQRVPEHAAVVKRIRIRRADEVKLLETRGQDILFSVKCQHGFYVRSLVQDFGRVLGVKARMMELRRTHAGGFSEHECCTLTQLQDAFELHKQGKPEKLEKLLLPLERAVLSLPKAVIKNSAATQFCKGAPLYAAGLLSTQGEILPETVIAVFDESQRLLGVGKALMGSEQMKKVEKGIIIKPEKIVVQQ